MKYPYKIYKTPDDYDSDDIVYDNGGKGFIPKEGDKRVCILTCPACKKENYAMSVCSGQCYWCGYQEGLEG